MSVRLEELSIIIICFKEGTESDSNFELKRSGTSCLSKGILLRGSFRGRLDSVLMMR